MAEYSKLKTFYAGKRWHDFRLMLIAERGPVCQRCRRVVTTPLDLIGHHNTELTPENVGNPRISLNPDNVILVCHSCHDEIHNRFGHKTERKVYLVYGAPLSGKHTLACQQMSRGDMMVDMDALYQAMSGLPTFDKPNNLYQNVMAAHDVLIDNIKTRYGKWNNAYIIGGYPEKRKREALSDELGAELVYCEATRGECMTRLMADEARRNRRDEWIKWIAEWFERYVE